MQTEKEEYIWHSKQTIQVQIQRVRQPQLRKISDQLFVVDIGDYPTKIQFFFDSLEDAKKVFNVN